MRARRLAVVLSVLAFAAQGAGATSYVPMTDEAVVDTAPAAAVVRVLGPSAAPRTGRLVTGWPVTDYRVRIERVLKGDLKPGTIIVRVPGGRAAGGRTLRIWGAPRFARGERALLFLAPREPGVYAVAHMMLGAFHEVAAGGRRLALRDLSEAEAVEVKGRATPPGGVRDFDRFAQWVAARARGERLQAGLQAGLQADYRIAEGPEPPLPRSLTERFTFLGNSRWFVFDSNGSAAFRAHQSGQPGLAGGGFTEFQTALAAWTNDPATRVSYTYAGTTTATGGLNSSDGVNALLFDQNLGTPYSCSQGGVLAMGGPWTSGTATYNGTSYNITVEGDVVTNQGISCFFTNSPAPSKAAEELFAHELGHTLGLGHSCGDGTSGSCSGRPDQNDAIMRASLHDDGRGARLATDDRIGLATLYSTPSDFFTLAPCRLLDTRVSGGAFAPGEQRSFSAAGQCGIPATAKLLVANITAVAPSGDGHLTLFPATISAPSTSTLNFKPGTTRANLAVLLLAETASRDFTIQAALPFGGAVHVIVDVNGYFQ